MSRFAIWMVCCLFASTAAAQVDQLFGQPSARQGAETDASKPSAALRYADSYALQNQWNTYSSPTPRDQRPAFGGQYGLEGGSVPRSIYSVSDNTFADQTIVYQELRSVERANGAVEHRAEMINVNINADLTALPKDLSLESKRDRIQRVTNARHPALVAALKKENDPDLTAKIMAKLKENYELNYRAETEWRQSKIADLKKRLAALESQLEDRTSNENDYVDASLKLAELHAKGLGVAPPSPGVSVNSKSLVNQGEYPSYPQKSDGMDQNQSVRVSPTRRPE